MNRNVFTLSILLVAIGFFGVRIVNAEETVANPAIVCRIQLENEPITPVTTHFIERALREAESNHAQCLVIELDTPGGLLDSTQQIVKDIIASPVPVVVYVSPSGSRAASAGMFITLASHVSAMAPGTRIGAAHPVGIGGLPLSPPQKSLPLPPNGDPNPDGGDSTAESPSVMEEKVVNDTKAWARGLATLRGRNLEWVEAAVSKSESITATEAVEQHVVDFVAADLADLLRQLNGREIKLQADTNDQRIVKLSTVDANIISIEKWWGEKLLGVVSNPNVAMLLMMFGVYGILHELFSSGWGIPGTLGAICLLLAFFGLSVLPINYAGLALVILAFALFAAEPFFASHGALAIGGTACLILGGTMLVDSPLEFMQVSLAVSIPIAIGTMLVVVFLVSRIIESQQSQVQTGVEVMQGAEAVAAADFDHDGDRFTGRLRVHGEWWNAVSGTPVASGETVRIDGCQGLTLQVSQAGGNIDSQSHVLADEGTSHRNKEQV